MVVRSLLRGIDRSAFEMHLCTVRPLIAADDVASVADGIELHSLDFTGRAAPIDRARIAAGLARVIRRTRPDVVHLHSGVAWYAIPWRMTDRRTPVMLEVHDGPSSGRVSAMNSRLERLLVRHLRATALVHSTHVQRDVAAAYGINSADVVLVPLGIDTTAYDRPVSCRDSWRAEHGVSAAAPLVLYVARIAPSKRVDLFVDVARSVHQRWPSAQFAVIGAGDADRFGQQDVRFLGHVDDLPAAYCAADLFLSTSDYEGFGLAVLEAMSAGLPVVSTKVGGVADLVVDGVTGRLVAPGDRASLAGAVESLLDDPYLRGRLGQAARARARSDFDVTKMLRRYESAYAAVAAR
jgi:glycosyltransferase involved in cell wall biosynthesis